MVRSVTEVGLALVPGRRRRRRATIVRLKRPKPGYRSGFAAQRSACSEFGRLKQTCCNPNAVFRGRAPPQRDPMNMLPYAVHQVAAALPHHPSSCFDVSSF
eukprot:4535776-Pleurochrysis_carterae.AAC.7